MTLVSGELKLVSDKPEAVSQVWLRASKERLHGTGMVTTGRDFEPVIGGIVSFTALPGPVVMVLLANGIPTSTVKLLVPDKENASLRECIEAAGLADDGTLNALEQLSIDVAALVEEANQAQLKSKQEAERAETLVAEAVNNGAALVRDQVKADADRAVAAAEQAAESADSISFTEDPPGSGLFVFPVA